MVKCEKCGAEIPQGASFCPGCGAPREPEAPAPVPTPTPPPAPQQTYYPPPPKRSGGSGIKGIVDTFLTKQMIMLGFFFGVLISWIAKIVGDVFSFDTNSLLYGIVNIVNYTFMAGVGFLLLSGGFLNIKLSKYIRVGLIVAGALILAANI